MPACCTELPAGVKRRLAQEEMRAQRANPTDCSQAGGLPRPRSAGIVDPTRYEIRGESASGHKFAACVDAVAALVVKRRERMHSSTSSGAQRGERSAVPFGDAVGRGAVGRGKVAADVK